MRRQKNECVSLEGFSSHLKQLIRPVFDGLKLRLGMSLSEDAQRLKHSNIPTYIPESQTSPVNKNLLYGGGASGDTTSATLTGFNTARGEFVYQCAVGGWHKSVESYTVRENVIMI